ncbi:MAG: ATP-dependent protease ATPase subunit HslU, partial [Proteobacteria bacterium]|nr:ATP-dependent protease ATPase subunit HslU [Pseudomonadota bacterium]
GAPFVKVEATKFTEVGYVGRDVESIIRDLVEIAVSAQKLKAKKKVNVSAEIKTTNRILDALVGKSATAETRDKFRDKIAKKELDDKEIEISVADVSSNIGNFEIPGATIGILNISDMIGKAFGSNKTKVKKLTVKEAKSIIYSEEADKLIDIDKVIREALALVENEGIVFIDEIDKITSRSELKGGEVSREGVQRDLLPLIEGTSVHTKYGTVSTDHILFIASGAFHISKPSDLLPELQGRLPIRVELQPLSKEDLVKILTEPEASLIKQYRALMATEGLTLDVTEDGVAALARIAAEINATVENIGARRLQTVMERVLDDVSFTATDRTGETVVVDKAFVEKNLGDLAKNTDLSKFIL